MIDRGASLPIQFVLPRFSTMAATFPRKADARTAAWDTLETEGVARFPFPPDGTEWTALSDDDLDEMPVLRMLRERT